MPSDSRPRKRKQPASPSTQNSSRTSPYHPNDSPRNQGRGRGRRQNSNQNYHHHHHQQNQHQHHQHQHQHQHQQTQPPPQPPVSQQPHPSLQRAPSRLSISTTVGSSSSSSSTPPMAPGVSSLPPASNPATAPSEDAEDIRLDSPPPDRKVAYLWEYATDEVVQSWSATGAKALKERILELLAGGKDNQLELCVVFQELIKCAIDDRLPVAELARLLSEILAGDLAPDGLDSKNIFLQAVSIWESSEPVNTAPPPPSGCIELLQNLRPNPLPDELLGLTLEASTLQALRLVGDGFIRKTVKVTTSMVYKQRKHNLLREESEGFSKLITEFFTASYSASPLEIVGEAGERVKGLIGAFELDPGRVLDILLDTAACTVVSNARFFVRLLQQSSWWPQQLADEVQVDNNSFRNKEEIQALKEKRRAAADKEFFSKLAAGGVSAFFDKFDHPRGNKVAAQLLGFKFRYYQREDVKEVTPENLLVLSALLIKIGFVDLGELYPHLAPHDNEGMQKVLTDWRSKLEAKTRAGRPNALMMAGALKDDTVPAPRSSKSSGTESRKSEEPKKEEEPKPQKEDNQKLMLLKYLLAVGALPEALFILGKYPWLPGPSSDIAEHLGRVLIESVHEVYEPCRRKSAPAGQKKVAVAAHGKTGIEKFDLPRRKPMVTFTVSNLKARTGDIEYRFFWEDWKEGVPVCRTPLDVVVLLRTLGKMLGVKIGRDPVAITQVCRIGLGVVSRDDCSEADRNDWVEIARSILVPAVSLTDGNAGLVNEVWALIKCFPLELRYNLYGEWTAVHNRRHPELKAKVLEVEKETRDLLKRISKTNVKQMSRQLAKVATSNPVTVMQVVLSQVEGYDNLIECVVDAATYFTPLGFDAIGFCILNSMSNERKNRVQADGMLTSKWLQSLSLFCGKLYTRYHRQMDPAPLLEYVARQLKRNHSVELIILQQLVQSMAGINAETNLNEAQLQGLAGGECLRGQILNAFRDRKAEDSPETMKTLITSLANQELAALLLILIAQERQTCIHRVEESEAPLKVLGNLLDEIHQVLSQYMEVLRLGIPPEQFDRMVPSVGPLCLDYGIDPAVAWWICRASIKTKMEEGVQKAETEDVEMKDANADNNETLAAVPEKKSPWGPILEALMEEVQPILTEQVWAKLSVGFYVTFWQLDLHDIFVPMDVYQSETNRINSAIRALDQDRSDLSIPGQARKREKREELMSINSRLSIELKAHIRKNQLIRKRLNQEKDHWFQDDSVTQRDITDVFIQYCLFPRVLLSPNDAMFCSRFIRQVHQISTPRFHTIGVFDSIFGKGLGSIIFICTQREAENYGRFLKEILSDLHGWHSDRTFYEREAHGSQKGLTGFVVKGQPFDWEDFRKILYKWHKTLHMAVKNCLSSKEYMHIRNAIVVLKHVHEFFPAIDWIGKTIVERVEVLVKSEKREDLKIAAMTLLGMLKKREKCWLPVSAFQKSELPVSAGSPSPAASQQMKSASPAPGQPQQSTRALNAMAADFKPTNAPRPPTSAPPGVQSQQSPKPISLPEKPDGDKEDGEIEDSRVHRSQPTSLPPRPIPHPPDQRGLSAPSQDVSHTHQQVPNRSTNRTPTPRKEDQRPGGDLRRPPERTDLSRQPPQRTIPLPQHQLPDRPDIRQGTLERRDLMRDGRDSPRENRGRPDGRLPEKPIERRLSPRRVDTRETRDIRDRHELNPRTSMARDRDFRSPLPQQWDDRSQRKDDRMTQEIDRPIPGPPMRQSHQMMDDGDRRGSDRDGRRRHGHVDQQSRLSDYPLERHEQEHRIVERKLEALPPRHVPESVGPRDIHEDAHSQRLPPVGPRGNFEREPRGPPPQKERDLFSGQQGGGQIRAPPSAPSHPSEQFRDARHSQLGGYHSQQDPNHGRLNPPDMTIPKGPRDRTSQSFGQRGGNVNMRAGAPPGAQSLTQHNQASPGPSPNARPLPSPAAESQRRLEMPPPPLAERSMQSAPSAVDIAVTHPERLKAIAYQANQSPAQPERKKHDSATPSPISNTAPPLGPRGRVPSPGPQSQQQNQNQGGPPSGPVRREGGEDKGHDRRRFDTLREQLSGGDTGRDTRGRGRRNGSNIGLPNGPHIPGRSGRDGGPLATGMSRDPTRGSLGGSAPVTPIQVHPRQELDRRLSSNSLHGDSRRGSMATQDRDIRAGMDDMRQQDYSSRSSGRHHHRSERSDRDRERDRADRNDRDRRAIEAERERERERELNIQEPASGRESRKNADRGGGGGGGSKDGRDREHRGDRESRRIDDRESSGRRDDRRKHPRDNDSGKVGRDDKRRRRGGEWGAD